MAPSSASSVPESRPSEKLGTHSTDRKSTRLNSSHGYISYAVFCLKKKKTDRYRRRLQIARRQHNPPLHRTESPFDPSDKEQQPPRLTDSLAILGTDPKSYHQPIQT